MGSFGALLMAALTAAAIPTALASPTTRDAPAAAGEFSISQVRNVNFRQRDGLRAMLHAYAKYNAPLSPQLQTAARLNAAGLGEQKKRRAGAGDMAGSVSASPPRDYDIEFVTPVGIGTPPQTLSLVIDTGSADFWVLSTDTPETNLASQPIYHPANSTTSKHLPNSTWSITYGDGSGASGITYTDSVTLGPAIHATDQTIQSALHVAASIGSDPDVSGLLGLGLSHSNTVRPARANVTLMDTLRPSLRQPLFAADLRSGGEGRFDFGFVDDAAYTAPMQYVPVNRSSPYWQFSPSGYSVGNGKGDKWVAKPWPVIADTGTSLLLLPDEIVGAYYNAVDGAGLDQNMGGIVFPCETEAPDFVFGIGFYRGVVPGRYMKYNEVNSTHCFGGIQSSKGIGFSIFGDVLLKAQYVVFDLGSMKLGFANKNLTS